MREKEPFPANWEQLRRQTIKRDRYRCQRCDKKLEYAMLTAHHMMPRAAGGCDDVTNLVTLCSPCHDFVEIHDLRTLADIMGSYDPPLTRKKRTEKLEEPEGEAPEETFPRPSWHSFVYGGGHNPLKDMSR